MFARLSAHWRRWFWIFAVCSLWFFGFFTGKQCSTSSPQHVHQGFEKQVKSAKAETWTCSMHPQIRMPKPGKCPICFMDLIPLHQESKEQEPSKIRLSHQGKILAEIQTSLVERRPVFLRVRMLGRVVYDETRLKTISAWIPGRLERMFVDYTGVPVRKGDHLVRIYSPELLSAQQELLQARAASSRVNVAKKK